MLTNDAQGAQQAGSGTATNGPRGSCGGSLQHPPRRVIGALLAAAVAGIAGDAARSQTRPGGTPDVAGVWIDDTGQGAVEIAPCADRLCGHVVWLAQEADRGGRPVVDDNNPDPARRRRPVCGLPVIGDLVRQRDGSWDRGWIYDPKVGKSYDVELRLSAPDRLRVTGYLGIKLLSDTFVWIRAPAGLQRCRVPGQAL